MFHGRGLSVLLPVLPASAAVFSLAPGQAVGTLGREEGSACKPSGNVVQYFEHPHPKLMTAPIFNCLFNSLNLLWCMKWLILSIQQNHLLGTDWHRLCTAKHCRFTVLIRGSLEELHSAEFQRQLIQMFRKHGIWCHKLYTLATWILNPFLSLLPSTLPYGTEQWGLGLWSLQPLNNTCRRLLSVIANSRNTFHTRVLNGGIVLPVRIL